MSDLAIAGQEPILWQSTKLAANDADRQTIVTNPDGSTTVIRHPQHGHIGNYENRQRAHGMRYANVLRHDGNIVALVLTNAAADTNSGGEYGNLMRAKARHHGWFNPGTCPVALIAVGQLKPELVVDKTILEDRTPCENGTYDEAHPCKHVQAEIFARRAGKLDYEKKKALEYKSEAEKAQAEANSNTAKMLEQMVAQGQNQNAMLEMFTAFMKMQLEKNSPPPIAPAPAPPPPITEPAPAPTGDVTAVEAKPEKAPKK